jgi:hypothetical protein
MGSEGSVPPSDGIPLVDAYGIPGLAWGAREPSGLVAEGLIVQGSKAISVFRYTVMVGLAPEPCGSWQSKGSRGDDPFGQPPGGISCQVHLLRDGLACFRSCGFRFWAPWF